MAKYRKKPVIVEAVQWFPDKRIEYVGVYNGANGELEPYVVTIHGQRAYLAPGDWIIAEPDGVHHYPCKPDIFSAIYEPVEVLSPQAESFA